MFSRIHDNLGRALLVLFLIKPTVDLGWFLALPIGITTVTPLHIFAGLLFVYLLQIRIQGARTTPPFLRLFEAFLYLHIISLFIGITTNDRLTLIQVVDFMLRIGDSYLIFYTAYLAATRYKYRDMTPFVKAIVIGSSIVIVANTIAAPLGWDFGVRQPGISDEEMAYRQRGLYYDPGVLANVAFFHVIFTVFLLHLSPSRSRITFTGPLLLLLVADLYLISITKSRAVMVEIALFGFFYLLVFLKGMSKIVAPIAASAVLGLAVLIFDVNLEDLFVRFESDAAALEGDAEIGIESGGEVSFGSLEGLGNNRVALWANALTVLLERPPAEMLFGNFRGSVAHSDYIDIMARSGLVSLVLYLVMMVGLTVTCLRLTRNAMNNHDRTIYFMAFVLLICYLFYALPFRPLNYTTTSWYMWTVIAMALARARLAPLELAAAKNKVAKQTEGPKTEPADGKAAKGELLRRPGGRVRGA